MLILTRKIEEGIIIRGEGENLIRFRILGISGGRVKVGIEAPGRFNILRDELSEEEGER